MTYSVYLRGHDEDQPGRIEDQTRTDDPAAALAAFRLLLARDDLIGTSASAVFRDQSAGQGRGRTLLFSRFDIPAQRLLPDDSIVLNRLTTEADSNTRAIVAQRQPRHPAPTELPALLKAYRARLGVTQEGLAKRWGVSKAWVMKTERGGTGAAAGPLRDLLGQLLA